MKCQIQSSRKTNSTAGMGSLELFEALQPQLFEAGVDEHALAYACALVG